LGHVGGIIGSGYYFANPEHALFGLEKSKRQTSWPISRQEGEIPLEESNTGGWRTNLRMTKNL